MEENSMSGGHFDYQQRTILEIADQMERELAKMGKAKPKEDLYCTKEFYDEYPEERFYCKYSDDVIDRMKIGVRQLKLAYIYAQRADWLFSGDDGEESYLERLKDEINALGYE